MPSSNKAPVSLPADTWTQIAAANFQSIAIQVVGSMDVQVASGASAPTIPESGLLIVRKTSMTIVDTDATSGLWARPAAPGQTATIRYN